jgi:hypothetical protein
MWLQLGGVCSSIGAGGAGVKGVHSGDGGCPVAGLSSVNGWGSAHVLTIHLSKEKSSWLNLNLAFVLGNGQSAMLARGVFVGTVY